MMAQGSPPEKPSPKQRNRKIVGRHIPLKSAPPCYGFTVAEFRRAVLDGELSVWKIGRENSKRPHWYLDSQEIERWIERRRERVAVPS